MHHTANGSNGIHFVTDKLTNIIADEFAEDVPEITKEREIDSSASDVTGNDDDVSIGYDVKFTAPDGGWGWVVVGAAMLSTCTLGYLQLGFTVLYVSIVEHFQAELGVAGWITSIYMFSGNILGVPIGAIVQRYGCRPVASVGALMGTVGLCLCYFLQGIPYLCLTFGIVTGFSSTLIQVPALVIVQSYFDKKRTLATGLANLGLSLGGLVAAPIINHLLHEYGLTGTFLISGGIWLHNLVFATFYRPVHSIKRSWSINSITIEAATEVVAEESIEAIPEVIKVPPPKTPLSNENAYVVPETKLQLPHAVKLLDNNIMRSASDEEIMKTHYLETEKKRTSPMFLLLSDMVNFSVLKNPQLVMVMTGTMLYNIGCMGFFGHYLNLLIHSGVQRHTAIVFQTMMMISIALGNAVGMCVGNLRSTDRSLMYGVLGTISSFVIISFGFVRTTPIFGLYGVLEGFVTGAFFSIQQSLFVDIAGTKNIAKVTGIFVMGMAIAFLVAVPLTGFIYDKSRRYDLPFFVLGCIVFTAGCFLLSLAVLRRTVWKK